MTDRDQTESGEFRWDSLGLDEGGLPKHLPFAITANGDGPADSDEAHRLVCWCNTDCPLNRSLDEAWRLGKVRSSPGESA